MRAPRKEELYEAPGGNLVDGLLPAPSLAPDAFFMSTKGRRVRKELVGRPDLKRQCDGLG
eukprot:5346871-Pyramimonas_sp.AAC.1